MFIALGFGKAAQWSDEKLAAKADQIIEDGKFTVDDVPEEFQPVFEQIADTGDDTPIEFVDDAPAAEQNEEETEQPDAERKKAKKKGKAAKAEKPEKVAKPGKAAKVEKTAKPKKAPAAPAKKDIPVDAYGCRVGTISNKVNEAITDEWQEEEEIAEAAGVSRDQARGRLYYGAEKGLFESRRVILYRLKQAPKKKKAA
jgi:hypothetical protein